MAAAILDLLNDPAKAARMGSNGRLLARERFSLETCIDQHLKVYLGVAKDRSGRRSFPDPRPSLHHWSL